MNTASQPRFKRGDTVRHRATGQTGQITKTFMSFVNPTPVWRYIVRKEDGRYVRWYEWAVVRETGS